MGLFNWLTGAGNSQPKLSASAQADSQLSFAGNNSTGQYFTSSQQAALEAPRNATTAAVLAGRIEQRKIERNARREQLFQAVREAMVRVGILSSSFRFKVLALDQRGKTFLVMIDLSSELGGETAKLGQIETLIAKTAKNRFEIVVQAVYWRFTEAVSSVAAQKSITPAASAHAPLQGIPHARPAPLAGRPSSMPPVVRPVGSRPSPAIKEDDPLDQAEVDAFKRALVAGTMPGVPAPTAAGTSARAGLATAAKAASLSAINNKLLLTGYEDTEVIDPDEPAPALSATQYGEFR